MNHFEAWGLAVVGKSVRLVEFNDQQALALSPVLPEVVSKTAAERDEWVVIVRRQSPYVLLGPKDQRLRHLSDAVAWLQSLGYPVFVRIGGGSAVLLDATCLSFGVARPCRDLTVWEKNFRELSAGTIRGLQGLGIPAEFGRAVGSYCEGPFDLVANGKKIAGIAQAIRQGFSLVSGMVLVHQDPIHTTEVLQEFYERAGSDLRLDPRAVTAINQLPGQSAVTLDRVQRALVSGYQELYDLRPEPLTASEWALAKNLYHERQLGAKQLEEVHDASHY